MARTDPQLNIRIPAELKAKLEQAAEASGRSVTTELIFRLEESFRREGKLMPTQEAKLADMRRYMEEQNAKILEEMKAYVDKRLGKPTDE